MTGGTFQSIRDLVKDSSLKNDAYKIFIDMSSLVRRLQVRETRQGVFVYLIVILVPLLLTIARYVVLIAPREPVHEAG